jgi:hypothetical protein
MSNYEVYFWQNEPKRMRACGWRRKPRRALELAGIEFIDENGGGPGVRFRKRQRAKQSK